MSPESLGGAGERLRWGGELLSGKLKRSLPGVLCVRDTLYLREQLPGYPKSQPQEGQDWRLGPEPQRWLWGTHGSVNLALCPITCFKASALCLSAPSLLSLLTFTHPQAPTLNSCVFPPPPDPSIPPPCALPCSVPLEAQRPLKCETEFFFNLPGTCTTHL